jgi:hypothetical protein
MGAVMRVRISFELDVPEETLAATVQAAAYRCAVVAENIVEQGTGKSATAGRVRASIFANESGKRAAR